MNTDKDDETLALTPLPQGEGEAAFSSGERSLLGDFSQRGDCAFPAHEPPHPVPPHWGRGWPEAG